MKIDDARENDSEGPRFLVKGERGGKNTYRFDGKVLELEAVLEGKLNYPLDYGIVLNTHCDDGEPLDGLLLERNSSPPGCIVEFRPVGTVKVEREGRSDEKIVCVASKDGNLEDIKDVDDLDVETTERVEGFFETYGYLNDEDIKVEGWKGKKRAKKLLKHARKLYKRKNK